MLLPARFALAFFFLVGILVFGACSSEDQNTDEDYLATSAYFSPDAENPERSLLPSPSVLGLNLAHTPPTLSIKATMCFEPDSATEASLDALEDLNGFPSFSAGNIVAFFGRDLDPASIEGRVVMLDLGTFGGDGSDAVLDTPIPIATVMTKTNKYLQGCAEAPTQVPTMIILPIDPNSGLPVILKGNHLYGIAFLDGILDVNSEKVSPFYIFSMIRSTTTVEVPALVPVQAAFAPALDAFEAAGYPRDEIILANVFNTQFTDTALQSIAGRLGSLGNAFDSTAVTVPATTLPVPPLPAADFLTALGLSCAAIGAPDPDGDGPIPACPGIDQFLSGEFVSPNFQQSVDIALPFLPVEGQPSQVPGLFSNNYQPAVRGNQGKKLTFLASTPTGTSGSYPVVIFQHPLTPTDPAQAASANKMAMLALANALGANGLALIAIDSVLAGDRQVQVFDALDNATELYSIINTDTTVTRDNIRQTVVDLLQLVRVLKTCTPAKCGGLNVDPNKIYFVGNSMGSVIGSVFTALSPDIERAVFNATGAGLVNMIGGSPVLSAELVPTLCLAGVLTNECCSDTPPSCQVDDLAVDPGFAQFKVVAQWMADPADPINYAAALASNVAGGEKRLLIQEATGDMVFPNSGSALLAGLLGFSLGSDFYRAYDPGACGQVPGGAHTMLLNNCGSATVDMQTDLITFFKTP